MTECFFPNFGKNICFQHFNSILTESPSQHNKAKQKSKKHEDQKGRIKGVIIYK